MNHIFLEILNNALVASVLIVAVIFIRICIKKAPRWISCALWGLVALKLVLPFRIESVLSLVPASKPIPTDIEYQQVPQITSALEPVDRIVNPVLASNFSASSPVSVNPIRKVVGAAAVIWIIGVVFLCIYALISYYMLRKKVAASRKICDRVYSCDEVKSPFILGIFRPRIYLPSGMDENMTACVLEHERAHLKRGDHFWKPLGFMILAAYWFQPLCWIGYILLCKDIELACDEKVTKDKDNGWKARYCQALLDCHVRQKLITACPVAFGEVSVKDRIKNILNYKKPAALITAAAVLLAVIVAVCFMTSQKDEAGLSVSGNADAAVAENDPENDLENVPGNDAKRDIGNIAGRWAEAVCAGDGEAIIGMADSEVIRQFEDEDILRRGDNSSYFSLGSSPMLEWPDDITSYVVVDVDAANQTADILYYGWTSDPHVEVIREQIGLSSDGDSYIVNSESLTYYDDIATAAEFISAYPMGIKDTLMNYFDKNNLGVALNQNALLSGSNAYRDLFSPQTAVYDLLNIGNKGNMRTEVINGDDTSACDVEINFPDGMITVTMIRPYGEQGIWLPYDYHTEAENGNILTMQELVRLVTTDSFLDELREKGVGYWEMYDNLTEDKTFDAESLTNLKKAQLAYDDGMFELQIYYWPADSDDGEYQKNDLDMIELVNVSTGDAVMLYTSDDRYTVDMDIEAFLTKQYELPAVLLDNNTAGGLDGVLTYSGYQSELFLNFSGALFENDNYREPSHGDLILESWYSLGGIGICTDPSYGDYETFSNGKLMEYRYTDNHMSSKFIAAFQNDEYSGCLYQYNVDLMTASEADLSGEKTAGAGYWVIFFTKGEGETLYMKFFNCSQYAADDALRSINGSLPDVF